MDDKQPPPGLTNYHFVSQIGKGGFGVVWKVLTVTDKLRALKVIERGSISKDGDTLFQMEFNGVKKFEDVAASSPSLITIHSVGLEDDYFYYVMPLADNAIKDSDRENSNKNAYEPLTLDTFLTLHGAFPFEKALEHMRHISEGVSQLHKVGLVHRDLNSSNILFIDGKIVIADPGLTENCSEKTQTFSRGFSSPDEEILPASDVFSLGKIFYHMITGLQPFDHYPYLSEEVYHSPKLPEIVHIIDTCCSLEPAERWTDASELHQHLKQVGSRPKIRRMLALGILTGIVAIAIGVFIFLQSEDEIEDTETKSVRLEGDTIIASNTANKDLWRKKLPSQIQQVDLIDLDEDGELEVVCSISNVTPKGTGRFYVIDQDGNEKWSFNTTLDFQNYPGFGEGLMRHVKYYIEDIDGKQGKEIILQTRNSLNWYPEGFCILSADGEFRSYYWHPGRIFEDTVIFTREDESSPTRIVFTALNNQLGKPFREVKCHRYIVCMIDPSVLGHHQAPPHKGALKSEDKMTCWYKILDPQKAEIRSLHIEDYTQNGKSECVVWYKYGARFEHADERINRAQIFNFAGESIASQEGDGNVKRGILRSPTKEDERKN